MKNWPITIGGTDYTYRVWASIGNTPDHHFYVSNNLVNWILISTFQFANTGDLAVSLGFVYYGFHDIINLNGAYYGFAETNLGRTVICKSANGDDNWEAFKTVGGTHIGDGNLLNPVLAGLGWTPKGSFIAPGTIVVMEKFILVHTMIICI